MPRRPRVGVALAGGFARGIAHIGVLRVLREADIPVDVVAGTSVGALIATAYCAGAPLEMMERVAHETKFTDFGRWTPSWLGLATNNRLEAFRCAFHPHQTLRGIARSLSPLPPQTSILVCPFTTTVARSARRLRASCAYPGLFVPVKYEGRTLVDGFLTALVPIEGTLLLGAEIVIAVYLEAGAVDEPRTFTDVLSRSFTIIQKHADLEWRKEADIIIEPNVTPFLWDDFTKTGELVRAGEEATLKALPAIRAALESKSVADSEFEAPETHNSSSE